MTEKILVCPTHSFTIFVRGYEITSRGTPGERVTGCVDCDRIVDEGLTLARFGGVRGKKAPEPNRSVEPGQTAQGVTE